MSEEQPRSPFKCLSLSGSVEAGKKKEVGQAPPTCVVHVVQSAVQLYTAAGWVFQACAHAVYELEWLLLVYMAVTSH